MVQAIHPAWGNRSCLRFGIYSEALDDEQRKSIKAKNRRIRYGVVVGMILGATLLVGLMVYDVVSGYGLRARDSDAVQRLLMLRRTTEEPEITTAKIITTTYIPTEGTAEPITTVTEPPTVLSDHRDQNTSIQIDQPDENLAESSQALPYRYTSLPERMPSKDDNRFSNREFRRNFEIDSFFRNEARNLPPKRRKEKTSDNHGIDDYTVYWSHHQPPRTAYGIQSRIMNNVKYQIPRPFRSSNFTTERPEHNSFQVLKHKQQDSTPYYSFGSLSKYPQLSTYRYPNEAKNIQDIIKYLTTEDSHNPSSSNNNHATFSFLAPTENSRRIKFAGVYKTAVKKNSGEDYGRPEESIQDTVISSDHNKMPDSSFNGHAYIADPFHDFKPSDPSEINLLANSDFRFAPFDSRVRFVPNRPQGTRLGVIEINPNDKFFPRPPINFGKPSTIAPPHDPVYQSYPGTYTTAIYRPLGKEPVTTAPHSSMKTPKSVKPFSVMLDIYPMMEDSTPQATSILPHKPMKPFVKPGHGLGPRVRFPQGRPPDPATDSETKHQMVVHLNLYPKRKKKHNFSDRMDDVQGFHVDLRSSTFGCNGDVLENLRTMYEEDLDNNEENKALRIEDEPETNTEGSYKQHIQSKVSEVMPTQEVISGGNRRSEVFTQVENFQRRPMALDIASSIGSPKRLRNQQGSNTPLDILLIPGTNTPTNASGIHSKSPEDSTNENRDTQMSAENIKL